MRAPSTIAAHIRRYIAVGAAFAMLANASPASAVMDWQVDDLKSKIQTWSQSIHFTLQEENFDQLEQWLHEVRFETPRAGDGGALLPVFYDALVNVIKTSPQQRLEISDKQWGQHFANWAEKYPASAAPHIAQARLYLARAWRARGNGFSNTVSADGQAAFDDYLSKARSYLSAHRETASTDPEFFVMLAKIEFLQSGDHEVLFGWTGELMVKFPDYVTAFPALALYLLPKWGGTPVMFGRWVDWAIQAGQQSDGSGLLARIYWATSGGPWEYADIRQMGRSWPFVKKAFADEMLHFPHAVTASRFLTVSCKAHDVDQAEQLFKALQNNPVTAQRYVGTSAAYCNKIGGTAGFKIATPPPQP